MSLKVGIVGLPNVGKSTLFNALLKRQQALVANYPFATIEPNVGVVDVPDERLAKLAEIVGTKKIVPATIQFVDIAGLVAGAATGAGLGNKFLAHIREVDVIVQVLRDFSDLNVIKEGSVDPKSDYEVVTSELILKDLETIDKTIRSKSQESRVKILEKLKKEMDSGKPAREVLTAKEAEEVADLCLLTMKKEIKVYNVDENVRKEGDGIYICARVEAELAGMDLTELGIEESGLDKLIKKAYQTLDLVSFLTAGELEVRAWTITKGTKAPQAAGVIHTDFEKKFIKAKVCDFQDFVTLGGWKAASEAGKVRVEGADYFVKDGDVIEFMVGR